MLTQQLQLQVNGSKFGRHYNVPAYIVDKLTWYRLAGCFITLFLDIGDFCVVFLSLPVCFCIHCYCLDLCWAFNIWISSAISKKETFWVSSYWYPCFWRRYCLYQLVHYCCVHVPGAESFLHAYISISIG